MEGRASWMLLGIVLLVRASCAHVSLTFPPARLPNYDFLDNVRTGGPCGIPESPNGVVTTLQAGITFNLTYHTAYPHQGGILVNLLAPNGTILCHLLGTTWLSTNDSTRFFHEVTLPEDFECDRCTLQLVRQAREWAAVGDQYLFWTCADVSIINSTAAVCNNMTCSGNGVCVSGRCECNRLYSGEFCQLKDECEDASDCNNQGSCINVQQGTTFPRKQCFCDPGWFGEGCTRVSALTDATIDPDEYTVHRVLNPRLSLYARIVGDTELEVALQHDGNGFAALGWRPSGTDGSCRSEAPGNFPVGTNPLWGDETAWPNVDGIPRPEPNEEIQLGETTDDEETGADGGQEEGAPVEGNEPLHPMDCTDIVIGMARGQQSRVFDYYTRDRATPQRDSFYGGVDSLTAAVGMEVDGQTSIKWRKPLEAGDVADHTITNSLLSVIWSYGQMFPYDGNHIPLSGIEAGTAQNDMFYLPDELKYHGINNRGATSINFFDDDVNMPGSDPCRGGFSTGCDPGPCDYEASWVVSGDFINFTVSAVTSDTNTEWVAIGFSDDMMMPNSDAVVGAADENGFFVSDRNIGMFRAPGPITDARQDITDAVATHENGVTTMHFIRRRNTGDSQDFSLEECRFLLYGWSGPADTTTQVVGFHRIIPIPSSERVCFPDSSTCPGRTSGTENTDSPTTDSTSGTENTDSPTTDSTSGTENTDSPTTDSTSGTENTDSPTTDRTSGTGRNLLFSLSTLLLAVAIATLAILV